MSEEVRPTMPPLAVWGFRLLLACVIALTVGGTIVKVAFPQLRGQGLTPAALAILVPIWGIGITGLIFLLASWIAEPFPQLPDGFTGMIPNLELSLFTRLLAAFVLLIFGVASLLLVSDSEQGISVAFRLGYLYFVASASAFILFLMFRYHQSQHPATRTYFVYFGPLLGVALAPLTWPFHLYLNWRVRNEIARRRAGNFAELKSQLGREYDA